MREALSPLSLVPLITGVSFSPSILPLVPLPMTSNSLRGRPLPPSQPQPTSLSSSPSPLPSYKLLSRALYSIHLQLHDEGFLPLLLPGLCDLVVDFLWEPLETPSYELIGRYTPVTPSLSHCTGYVHSDTQQRDDWSPTLRSLILQGWRLQSIRYWSNVYANGFAVTYQNPHDPTQRCSTKPHKGNHHNPVESTFTLGVGERIQQVQVTYSVWVHRVVLETNHGRKCEIGRGGASCATDEGVGDHGESEGEATSP